MDQHIRLTCIGTCAACSTMQSMHYILISGYTYASISTSSTDDSHFTNTCCCVNMHYHINRLIPGSNIYIYIYHSRTYLWCAPYNYDSRTHLWCGSYNYDSSSYT